MVESVNPFERFQNIVCESRPRQADVELEQGHLDERMASAIAPDMGSVAVTAALSPAVSGSISGSDSGSHTSFSSGSSSASNACSSLRSSLDSSSEIAGPFVKHEGVGEAGGFSALQRKVLGVITCDLKPPRPLVRNGPGCRLPTHTPTHPHTHGAQSLPHSFDPRKTSTLGVDLGVELGMGNGLGTGVEIQSESLNMGTKDVSRCFAVLRRILAQVETELGKNSCLDDLCKRRLLARKLQALSAFAQPSDFEHLQDLKSVALQDLQASLTTPSSIMAKTATEWTPADDYSDLHASEEGRVSALACEAWKSWRLLAMSVMSQEADQFGKTLPDFPTSSDIRLGDSNVDSIVDSAAKSIVKSLKGTGPFGWTPLDVPTHTHTHTETTATRMHTGSDRCDTHPSEAGAEGDGEGDGEGETVTRFGDSNGNSNSNSKKAQSSVNETRMKAEGNMEDIEERDGICESAFVSLSRTPSPRSSSSRFPFSSDQCNTGHKPPAGLAGAVAHPSFLPVSGLATRSPEDLDKWPNGLAAAASASAETKDKEKANGKESGKERDDAEEEARRAALEERERAAWNVFKRRLEETAKIQRKGLIGQHGTPAAKGKDGDGETGSSPGSCQAIFEAIRRATGWHPVWWFLLSRKGYEGGATAIWIQEALDDWLGLSKRKLRHFCLSIIFYLSVVPAYRQNLRNNEEAALKKLASLVPTRSIRSLYSSGELFALLQSSRNALSDDRAFPHTTLKEPHRDIPKRQADVGCRVATAAADRRLDVQSLRHSSAWRTSSLGEGRKGAKGEERAKREEAPESDRGRSRVSSPATKKTPHPPRNHLAVLKGWKSPSPGQLSPAPLLRKIRTSPDSSAGALVQPSSDSAQPDQVESAPLRGCPNPNASLNPSPNPSQKMGLGDGSTAMSMSDLKSDLVLDRESDPNSNPGVAEARSPTRSFDSGRCKTPPTKIRRRTREPLSH